MFFRWMRTCSCKGCGHALRVDAGMLCGKMQASSCSGCAVPLILLCGAEVNTWMFVLREPLVHISGKCIFMLLKHAYSVRYKVFCFFLVRSA